MKGWTLFLLLLCCQYGYSQNSDSLWGVFNTASLDSVTRIKSLHRMARQMTYHNPDSAMKLAMLEQNFAESMHDSNWIALSYNVQGGIYAVRNDFASAMDRFYRMLDIRISLKDTAEIGTAYNNIGNIFYHKGDYPKALEFYIRSLRYEELAPTDAGLAASYLNIGSVYALQEEYSHALVYFKRALTHYEKLPDGSGIANCYANIGNIYKSKDSLNLAVTYFLNSIPLMQSAKDHFGLSTTYANLADAYRLLNDYPKMFSYFKKCEELRLALDDRLGLASLWIKRGFVYAFTGDYVKAKDECKRGLVIASEVGALPEIKDACECLYLSYKGLKQEDLALAYYERHSRLLDSLAKDETLMQLQVMEFRAQVTKDSINREAEKLAVAVAHQMALVKGKQYRNIFLVIGILLVFLSLLLYRLFHKTHRSKKAIELAKGKADELLLNILPAEITEELMQHGKVEAQQFENVTMLFTDMVGFTHASAHMHPQELLEELNHLYSRFDEIVAARGIEKIKSIGDAYMAAGGLLLSTEASVKSTVLAGLDMQDYIQLHSEERKAKGLCAFEMRVGIHTGPVVAGIIGVKKFQYDVWGDTVNTANRMETNGAPGRVNISETTYKFIQKDTDFIFERRNKIAVKGKGEMQMYFVKRGNHVEIHEMEDGVLLHQYS